MLSIGVSVTRMAAARTYVERNRMLVAMGFATYGDYLRSDLWAKIRARVFGECGNLCFVCGKWGHFVHHRQYTADNLAGRSLDGLSPVCKPCHDLIECDRRAGKRFDFGAIEARAMELQAKAGAGALNSDGRTRGRRIAAELRAYEERRKLWAKQKAEERARALEEKRARKAAARAAGEGKKRRRAR